MCKYRQFGEVTDRERLASIRLVQQFVERAITHAGFTLETAPPLVQADLAILRQREAALAQHLPPEGTDDNLLGWSGLVIVHERAHAHH